MTVPLQTRFERIVLTGFMGSGKTTVGRLLGQRLGWRFADLDDRVAAAQGQTVPEIFAFAGEPAFRVAETAALRELLAERQIVIALGGGAPGTPLNRDLLAAAPGTAVVHLDAPFAVLFDRCRAQAENPFATARPLLGDRTSSEARYRQRSALYASIASHVQRADDSPEAIVAGIVAANFGTLALPDSPPPAAVP